MYTKSELSTFYLVDSFRTWHCRPDITKNSFFLFLQKVPPQWLTERLDIMAVRARYDEWVRENHLRRRNCACLVQPWSVRFHKEEKPEPSSSSSSLAPLMGSRQSIATLLQERLCTFESLVKSATPSRSASDVATIPREAPSVMKRLERVAITFREVFPTASPLQLSVAAYLMRATLPQIADGCPSNELEQVKAALQWDPLDQLILLLLARREGKTVTVCAFIATLLLVIPHIHVLFFTIKVSTGLTGLKTILSFMKPWLNRNQGPSAPAANVARWKEWMKNESDMGMYGTDPMSFSLQLQPNRIITQEFNTKSAHTATAAAAATVAIATPTPGENVMTNQRSFVELIPSQNADAARGNGPELGIQVWDEAAHLDALAMGNGAVPTIQQRGTTLIAMTSPSSRSTLLYALQMARTGRNLAQYVVHTLYTDRVCSLCRQTNLREVDFSQGACPHLLCYIPDWHPSERKQIAFALMQSISFFEGHGRGEQALLACLADGAQVSQSAKEELMGQIADEEDRHFGVFDSTYLRSYRTEGLISAEEVEQHTCLIATYADLGFGDADHTVVSHALLDDGRTVLVGLDYRTSRTGNFNDNLEMLQLHFLELFKRRHTARKTVVFIPEANNASFSTIAQAQAVHKIALQCGGQVMFARRSHPIQGVPEAHGASAAQPRVLYDCTEFNALSSTSHIATDGTVKLCGFLMDNLSKMQMFAAVKQQMEDGMLHMCTDVWTTTVLLANASNPCAGPFNSLVHPIPIQRADLEGALDKLLQQLEHMECVEQYSIATARHTVSYSGKGPHKKNMDDLAIAWVAGPFCARCIATNAIRVPGVGYVVPEAVNRPLQQIQQAFAASTSSPAAIENLQWFRRGAAAIGASTNNTSDVGERNLVDPLQLALN